MVQPLDPTAAAFLLAENRRMPMHVGGLQLFAKPEGAGANFVHDLYGQWRESDDIAPLFLKHPVRSVRTGGQYVWREDDEFDIEYHVRHSALPKPGRVRELLELCSRLHSTRLATERPLWEWHLIEGLRDGRVAMYAKLHHALVDGISAMRLLQSILTTDPAPDGHAGALGEQAVDGEGARGAGAGRAVAVRHTPAGVADGARHQRRGRRHARRARQDPAQVDPQRDLDPGAVRPTHDPQPADHRGAQVRRPGLAAGTAAQHRQGQRVRP